MNEVNNKAKVRAFLAVDPPEAVRQGIAAVQNRLKKQLGASVRWVRPEGIHLTLKFFGDIALTDVETISATVREQIRGQGPLMLHVKKIGVFPNERRPRVIWLGIGGDVSLLVALQKKIDKALENFGFPRENRSFSPHLTLGRVKSPQGLNGLGKLIEESDDSAGEFSAAELILFKSDLRPDGAVYTKLEVFPFS
ncbi:MAG: RNA 2',3'-cyclic phosphodiesterase [Deltaproteobacteria bacterium]|nr:RNA 2',3'-cyclic phosphodiesterase [Deltaproteobacteria bacterium]